MDYSKWVKYDKLISPDTNYECKIIYKNNIKLFGFISVDDLHKKYPGFPTKCQETRDKQDKSRKKKRKKFIHPEDNIPSSELFLDNGDTKKYFSIIKEARDNNKDMETYTELHHIIPRSLGGSDHWSNIVKLTAKQHFLCHYYLTKSVERESPYYHKMLSAINMMKSNNSEQERYFDAILYEESRIEFRNRQSINQSGNSNSQYGSIWICNWELQISKKCKKEELQEYLDKGWSKQRINNFAKYEFVNGEIIPKKKANHKEKKPDKPVRPENLRRCSLIRIKLMEEYFGISVSDMTEDHKNLYIQKMTDHIWRDNLSPREILAIYHPSYEKGPGVFVTFLKDCLGIKTRTRSESLKLFYSKK